MYVLIRDCLMKEVSSDAICLANVPAQQNKLIPKILKF